MWKVITLTQQILHRRCKLALAININYGQSQKPGSRDAASLASYFEADLVCTMGGWVGTIKWPPGRRPASDVVCQAGKVRPKHKSANLVGLPPPVGGRDCHWFNVGHFRNMKSHGVRWPQKYCCFSGFPYLERPCSLSGLWGSWTIQFLQFNPILPSIGIWHQGSQLPKIRIKCATWGKRHQWE